MESTWMKSYCECLILKNRRNYLKCAGCVVPNADRLIFAASNDKLLSNANIHTSDGLRVEIADDILELSFIISYVKS
jgi:hypothetical protein